jgi:hypothetical protein
MGTDGPDAAPPEFDDRAYSLRETRDEPGPKPKRGSTAEIGYHFRDALRLLFILVAGSESVDPSDQKPDAPRVFVGEKRAMAIDFLVRYPDYLANDLLDLYEANHDPALLNAVRMIFEDHEPDVRLVAMVRWRWGAFQNIETALAILDSRKLVRSVKRKLEGNRVRYEFFIESSATKQGTGFSPRKP